MEDQFVKTQKNLSIDSNGLLDVNINADRMNLPEKGRLCDKELKFHQVDTHLINCSELNDDEVELFIIEQTENTKGMGGDINEQLYNYCDLTIEDPDISDIFFSVSHFKKFLSGLESFLDQRALTVYKKAKVLGSLKHSELSTF